MRDPTLERVLAIAERRPGWLVPVHEVEDELSREIRGPFGQAPTLRSWVARHGRWVRVVRSAHASWDSWQASDGTARSQYGAALPAEKTPAVRYLVPLGAPPPDVETSGRAAVLARLHATVGALARELDEEASLAAARWGRLSREALKVHEVLAGRG